MAVSKSLFVVLAALAVAQSARVARQVGVWPHAVPVHGGDDGSYWAGKYGPENIQDPSALATPHAAPVAAWAPHAAPAWAPHAAPAWAPAAPAWAPAAAWPHAAPAAVAPHWGADDGSYWAGKYGPESQ